MSKIYSSIFQLQTRFTSLEDIKPIFQRIFNRPLAASKKDTEKVQNMSHEESHFFYTWVKENQIEDFEVYDIYSYESEEQSVSKDKEKYMNKIKTLRFQRALCNIEYGKRRKKDSHGNFLPKSERLNNVEISTIFFELSGSIFVIILTANLYHTERVKSLIGMDNLEEHSERYSLNPDMFNWLVYNYSEQNGQIDEETSLKNISGFIGNVLDSENIIRGKSEQTTELIVTKAFISNGGKLTSVTLRVADKNIDLTFAITDSSAIVINSNISEKYVLFSSMDQEMFFVLYVYTYLIIKLKRIYESEADIFKEKESPKFSKKIGLEVIRSIVQKNKITMNEVRNVYEKSE